MKPRFGRIEEVNKELWLLLSLFGICLLLNLAVDGQRMVLSFYTLPTLGSAYLYGRRHATLTAFGSVLLVCLMTWYNPVLLAAATANPTLVSERWLDIVGVGRRPHGHGLLDGHALRAQRQPDRRTAPDLSRRADDPPSLHREGHLHGEPLVSRLGLCRDDCGELELPQGRIEDVRSAALLHDIGKLDISRELLYKAARLTEEEFKHMQEHVNKGVSILEPVGGSLRRVIPIVLSHHDKFDGSGYNPTKGQDIPLEARIISVADVYDSLTSDRPYRKAMSTFDAKEIIVKGSGTDFDPSVVQCVHRSLPEGRAGSSDGRRLETDVV